MVFLTKPIDVEKLINELSEFLMHEKVVKNTQSVSDLPSEIIISLIYKPEILLSNLHQKILPILHSLTNAFILSDYKQLSVLFKTLSKTHNIPLLSDEAEEILNLSDSFNINGINKSINKLTQSITSLITELEKSNE